MTELVVLEQLKPLELFTPEGATDILERIKKEARSHLLDISTKKGRDQITSLAYKIAKSKTYLDDLGKDLVTGWKKQSAAVDLERKRIRDELDALKEEIRAPLTEWENKEKERVENHELELVTINQCATYAEVNNLTCDKIQGLVNKANELYARDWQEFTARANLTHKDVIDRLEKKLAMRKQYEAEQAELERLRREEAERKERERDERLKTEASAKAKAEAEEKARKEAEAEAERVKAEQEKAEQERLRLQREKEAAQREKEAAEARARKAEEDRVAAIKKAEADRKAAAEKAEQERIAAEALAKREKEAAVQAERERAEAARKAEADAAAKREADKKHRAKVNNEVLNGIVEHCNSETVDITPQIAKAIVEAIAKGLIPHVKINY